MPSMSGRQLAQPVGAANQGTKVLYMSGYADDVIVRPASKGLAGRHRHESQLLDRGAGDDACAAARLRSSIGARLDDAGGVGGRVSGCSIARHSRNVIPFIGGEEEKMETETLKILGENGGRAPDAAVVSAHTNRVPVIHGHTMTISVDLGAKPSIAEIIAALEGFSGRPQVLDLPSAPQPPIVVMHERTRPQPRLDADRGDGMIVTVGSVRDCKVLHAKMVALGHNTVRGAAGAAILNVELMAAEGYFD